MTSIVLATLYAIAIYTLGVYVGWLITHDHHPTRPTGRRHR